MLEIAETPYQYGTCRRCGHEAEREGRGDRWHNGYGRDRCRMDSDDGECDVPEFRDGVRLSKLVETETLTITLTGEDGKVLLEQQVAAGMDYSEQCHEPLTVAALRLTRHRYKYKAALTPEEEIEALASRQER